MVNSRLDLKRDANSVTLEQRNPTEFAQSPRGDQYFRVLQLVAHWSMKGVCLRERRYD